MQTTLKIRIGNNITLTIHIKTRITQWTKEKIATINTLIRIHGTYTILTLERIIQSSIKMLKLWTETCICSTWMTSPKLHYQMDKQPTFFDILDYSFI